MNLAYLSDFYRMARKNLEEKVLSLPDTKIINSETGILIEELYRGNHFEIIEKDLTQQEKMSFHKEIRTISAEDRDESYRNEGSINFEYEIITIDLPIKTNFAIHDIIQYTPSTHSLSWSPHSLICSPENIVFKVDIKGYGFKLDDQAVKNKIEFEKNRRDEWISRVNADIIKENEEVREHIERIITSRKTKVKADIDRITELAKSMGLGEPTTNSIKIESELVDDSVAEESETFKPLKFDVFISHASEDKDYVGELAQALKQAGIKVWYDEYILKWGDSLRETITQGLLNSSFGIVVFSKHFLGKKKWTEFELDSLFAREEGTKVILPIWHNISREDFLDYDPAFANRMAKQSNKDTIEDIVADLKKLIEETV